MDALFQDLRYAARLLARNPGFGAVMVLTLALGIGGVSAIASLVDAVLLRPLPFREPSRLALIWESKQGNDHNVVGPYNFIRWRERSQSWEGGLAAFQRFEFNVVADDEPERLAAGIVTGNLFDLIGIAPVVGRPLTEADSAPGAPDVIVLSEGYWRRRFAADPRVVGRSLEFNGAPATIVGVVPASLQLPPDVAVWVPITLSDEFRTARGRWMIGLGRLKEGVTLAQARDEMQRLAADLGRENPDFNTGWSVNVQPLHADLVRDLRPAIVVLLVAVGLVLLIACTNVANLLLSRALAREREIALRGALGASRGRVLAQLLTESLLVAVLGGALGLLFGRWSLAGIVALLPPEVPLVVSVALNGRVLALTAAAALTSVLLFGLAPAVQLARPTLVEALRQGATVRGSGGARLRLKNGLIVGEVALSIALLTVAGLLLRSFLSLSRVDPGFRTEGVLTAQVNLPYRERAQILRFYDRTLAALEQSPGVRAVGAISWMPMTGGAATSFRALDRPKPPQGQAPVADVRFVTPGLFSAIGIPLRQGRGIVAGDREGASVVVVVNEAAARELWPGRSPLGQRIAMSWGSDLEAEVVGVVGDVRLSSLEKPARAALYWAQAQVPNSFMTLIVRSDGAFEPLGAAVRAAVAAVDPKIPVRLRPFSEVVETSLASRRFLLLLTQAFAALAVLLAGIGIYGVVSYSVARRTSEIGVRLALGAGPGDVARLVLNGAARLGALGVACGLAGAAAGAALLRGLLFGVGPWDPWAYAAVGAVGLLLTIAVAALPARRASRVEPASALREE
jgi:putative ABC transport system permease protein